LQLKIIMPVQNTCRAHVTAYVFTSISFRRMSSDYRWNRMQLFVYCSKNLRNMVNILVLYKLKVCYIQQVCDTKHNNCNCLFIEVKYLRIIVNLLIQYKLCYTSLRFVIFAILSHILLDNREWMVYDLRCLQSIASKH